MKVERVLVGKENGLASMLVNTIYNDNDEEHFTTKGHIRKERYSFLFGKGNDSDLVYICSYIVHPDRFEKIDVYPPARHFSLFGLKWFEEIKKRDKDFYNFIVDNIDLSLLKDAEPHGGLCMEIVDFNKYILPRLSIKKELPFLKSFKRNLRSYFSKLTRWLAE